MNVEDIEIGRSYRARENRNLRVEVVDKTPTHIEYEYRSTPTHYPDVVGSHRMFIHEFISAYIPKTYVNAAIIGELINGEVPYWTGGVCTVTWDTKNQEIDVKGESGRIIDSFKPIEYADPDIYGWNLTELADDVNDAIEREQAAL